MKEWYQIYGSFGCVQPLVLKEWKSGSVKLSVTEQQFEILYFQTSLDRSSHEAIGL